MIGRFGESDRPLFPLSAAAVKIACKSGESCLIMQREWSASGVKTHNAAMFISSYTMINPDAADRFTGSRPRIRGEKLESK